jgi:hypothetical protein
MDRAFQQLVRFLEPAYRTFDHAASNIDGLVGATVRDWYDADSLECVLAVIRVSDPD